MTRNPAPPVETDPAPRAPASPADLRPAREPAPPVEPASPRSATALDDAAARSRALAPAADGLEPVAFREVWAYLFRGEERHYDPRLPISDLCLFHFRLDDVGRIEGSLDAELAARLARGGARTHLVVSASGGTLFHFLLDPRYGARDRLLDDLIELASRHETHGFQVDFEAVRAEESADLVSFLRELRARLPAGRVFSICLPAMTGDARRAYDYRDVAALADRFFVMGYDLHWQGGPPGAVSPREWLERVARHALERLPPATVVVGLPFYGRVWQIDRLARATRHRDIDGYLSRPGVEVTYDADASHSFTFLETVEAEGWFDDAVSLHRKLRAARDAGARAVGFWRLGQEDPGVWDLLRVEGPGR